MQFIGLVFVLGKNCSHSRYEARLHPDAKPNKLNTKTDWFKCGKTPLMHFRDRSRNTNQVETLERSDPLDAAGLTDGRRKPNR